ncbi:MAG: hypothetical protein ABGY96_30985, partial [bacterium]
EARLVELKPCLQLLDIDTRMNAGKTVRINQGVHKTSGTAIRGYEIHVGETKGADSKRPFARDAQLHFQPADLIGTEIPATSNST